MLRTRLLTAIVLIPLVIGTVILDSWWLLIFMGGAIVLCGYEYFTMLIAAGHRPERALGVLLIAALVLDSKFQLGLETYILLTVVVLPPVWEFRRAEHQDFLTSWALTVLGVLYLGLLGAFLFKLRALEGGAALLGVTLMGTWAADSGAYVFGHAMGRHAFFPHISPKKTWEGAIGGVACAALTFGALMSLYGVDPWIAYAAGIGLGIAATIGDLVESLIKRQTGIKDSGSLIVGHGGVLDRLDSMFFTVTFIYCFFSMVRMP